MGNERDLGIYIGNRLNEQEVKNTSVQKRGAVTTYFLLPNYVIRLYTNNFYFARRAISDYFVVGHSVNSQIGSSRWKVGGPADSWTILSDLGANLGQKPVTIQFRKDTAAWLNGEGSTPMTHGALGTGTTAYDFSDVELETQSGVRKLIESRDYSTDGQVTFKVNFMDLDTADISEMGLFSAATNGTMLSRYVTTSFGPFTLSKLYEYQIVLNLKIVDNTPGDAMVTTYGLNEIRDMSANQSADIPDYIEWSNSTGTMSASDTNFDGASEQRNAASTFTNSRPPAPGYKVSWLGILTSGQLNGTAITKSGLFTDSGTSATLFAQNQFGTINKTALFKIQEQPNIFVR